MSIKSVPNVEKTISILEEAHARLIKVLRGQPVSERDPRLQNSQSVPHVAINEVDLRMAIGNVSLALKEAARHDK